MTKDQINEKLNKEKKMSYLEFEKEPMDNYYNSLIIGIPSRYRVKKVIEELKINKINKIVLDAGCEAGYLSREIGKCGLATISFDICISAIREFKERKNKKNNIMIASVHNIPLKKNSVDSIVISGVIEHLYDLNSTFKELKDVVKEDGSIIITFPYEKICKIFYPIIRIFGIDTTVEKNVTLFSYSLNEVKKLCKKFFLIKKTYQIPSFLFPLHNIIVCEKKS